MKRGWALIKHVGAHPLFIKTTFIRTRIRPNLRLLNSSYIKI